MQLTLNFFKTITFLSILMLLVSCESEAPNTSSTTTTTPTKTVENVTLNGDQIVNLKASKIFWKGYKIMGNHTGTIDLSEGQMSFNNGEMTGGKFVVDMNSVKVTELMDDGDDEEEEEDEDEGPEDDKSDLANHLMHGDFFDSKTYPTASFVINKTMKKGNDYQVEGNMTIKGVTKPVSFTSQLNGKTFTATIPVNRTEFGIKYGSGSFFSNLGDNVIKDNFDLEVKLVLK